MAEQHVPEATGERLIPEAYEGEIVVAEHVARYRLAARLAPGRRVADVACGEGYGTAMLAAAGASSVVGIDVDEPTVRHAAGRYGVDARAGDILALPLPDAAFDLVVSFETIEHVAEPLRALDELRRVLAPGGVLIVSTPNPREYREPNPFHLRELDPDEFVAALRARFASVRPLYQQNFLLSAVLDEERLATGDPMRPMALDVSKSVALAPGRELYTLALCGVDAELPGLEADVAVASGVYEAHELAANVRAWQERAMEAERIQREWEARSIEAERQNEELRATIERIRVSISWRITAPLRRLRRR